MRLAPLCLALLIAAAQARADYVTDRAAAAALDKAGEVAKARAAFLALAQGELSEFQRADALEQAALLSGRLKRFDEAIALARQIPLPHVAKAVEMQLLSTHRERRHLIKRFGKEDLATWPDRLIGNAAHCRGKAHYALKNGEAAERDLKMASEHLLEDNSLGLALIALGDTYRHLLKDKGKALVCYRQAYQRRNVYKRANAIMSAAAVLREQGKTEAALKELALIPMDQMTLPYWRARALTSWAGALAGAGRKDEAIAKYEEAVALEGITDRTREACRTAVARLRGANQ